MEDENKKIFYNREKQEYVVDKKLPDLKNIKMISSSPSYKIMAYLSYVATN